MAEGLFPLCLRHESGRDTNFLLPASGLRPCFPGGSSPVVPVTLTGSWRRRGLYACGCSREKERKKPPLTRAPSHRQRKKSNKRPRRRRWGGRARPERVRSHPLRGWGRGRTRGGELPSLSDSAINRSSEQLVPALTNNGRYCAFEHAEWEISESPWNSSRCWVGSPLLAC